MKDRIKQLQDSLGLTQKDYARFLESSEAMISNIYKGRTAPTMNIVNAVKSKLPNINTDWLLFGEGEMYKDSEGVATSSETDPSAVQPSLFDAFDVPSSSAPVSRTASRPSSVNQKKPTANNNNVVATDVTFAAGNNFDIKQRKITEIRVFFDDQTYESFVPRKD